MPSMFYGQCHSCGYESPTVTDEGYGGVQLDDTSQVDVEQLHRDDHRIVIICDRPGGFDGFKPHGYSATSATFSGRYLWFHRYLCKSCGQTYETRRLDAARFSLGCLTPIVVAVGIGVATGFHTSSLFLGLVTGFVSSIPSGLLIDWMVGHFVRLRFPKRAAEFRTKRHCPKCGSRRVVNSDLCYRPDEFIACPNCGERKMQVHREGFMT